MAKVKEHPVIFNKGLNTSLSSVGYDLHPVKMDNCWLSRDDRGGAVEVMPGYSTFHTFADADVAIQSIGSSGVKKYSFALYALGGTKFYRYVITDAPAGPDINQNIATKTGLSTGMGSIFFYGDVDGSPNAWVFNGVDSPFMSAEGWAVYDTSTPYNFDDIGVERPDATDYSTNDSRIYIVAGDADSGPSVQAFLRANLTGAPAAADYTDDTTNANDDAGTQDTNLGFSGWNANNVDGLYIAGDTPFGGILLDDYTPQNTGTITAKYQWQYWNGSGWQNLRSVTDGTVASSVGFTASAGDVEVTWTTPTTWPKNKLSDAGGSWGPYYWVRCIKKAGLVATNPAQCDRIFLLDQQFGEDEAEGVVQYRISKLDGTSESALSAQLKQADGTEGIDAGVGGTVKIVIDMNDSTDPSETYYDTATFKVYRTYEDGAQPYDTGLRIVTDATANGEVEDNIADNELGNLPYLHGDVPPSTCLPALPHFNRIFAAVPSASRVYWSDLANPESFWTDDNGSYAEVFPGDGDEITALARDRDGILVFKHNHLYKLVGRTPDQFYVSEITLADINAGTVGTPSIRGVTYTPSGIVFYYNKAVYLYNGSYPTKISGAIDEDLRAIDSSDEMDNVCIGYYANRNQVYLSVPVASSTPDRTYIFDMDVGQWTGRIKAGFRQFLSVKTDAEIEPYILANTNITTGELFFGVDPAASGKVFLLDDGTDFDGSAINTNFQLSPFFGSSINQLKTFMYVDVLFAPVADGLFNLEWWINGESGDSTIVPVTMDKTGYGLHRRRVNIGYKGRDLTLELKNNASYSGSWKIYGFVIGYIEHESYSL